jgi:signal transduction histidine kinase
MAETTSDARHPKPGRLARLLRAHAHAVLWTGFAAAAAAIVLLLVLQYRWLDDLQRSSALARRAVMTKVLDVLSKEAWSELKTAAEPVFRVDAADLTEEGLRGLGRRFDCPQREGVRTVFVFSVATQGTLYFLDEATHQLVVPEYSEETLAVWSAVAPWTVLAKKGAKVEDRRLHSDDRDPHHRILLRVVPDTEGHLAGIAGLVIEDAYMAQQVLPKAIRSTLSSFPKGEEVEVFVSNDTGEPVVAGGRKMAKEQVAVARRLTTPFSDWTVAVQDRRSTPERLARRNFLLNMTLSLALAGLLLSAVLLTTRTASREMRLSAMKSDFVSNVSHELRTPLASIRVFGELMRTGRVGAAEKVREYGERIETEAVRLGLLVENILDFSRIESGRKAYRFTEADLAAVVRASVESCAARFRSAGFEIELAAPAGELPALRLDPSAFEQALCNLLDNAVKYSGEGRLITVHVERRGEDAVVSVRDRGIGIPREEQRRIFERFHRVGSSLVHEVRGVGLGLAIVRHIVDAHGGRVLVESQPGAGSTFSLVLPLGQAAGRREQRAVSGLPAGAATGGRQ